MASRIVFVTGTDTNVGKTVVTALALCSLQTRKVRVRALKPFCSGERTDAFLLAILQRGALSLDRINPFYFGEPVSPWTAARRAKRAVTLEETLSYLRREALDCDLLVIEGAGGLLSPLGERFNASDLIVELGAEVILVAENRLGIINHTLLSVEALTRRNVYRIRIALVDSGCEESAVKTNEQDLRLLLPSIPIIPIPYLADFVPEADFIRGSAARLEVTLDSLF